MKKELQRNVNGMTSGGGSIQHPFSIHSASIGTRWKLHGLQSLMMTILLLFTMAIGQMWGADQTFTVEGPVASKRYVQDNIMMTGEVTSKKIANASSNVPVFYLQTGNYAPTAIISKAANIKKVVIYGNRDTGSNSQAKAFSLYTSADAISYAIPTTTGFTATATNNSSPTAVTSMTDINMIGNNQSYATTITVTFTSPVMALRLVASANTSIRSIEVTYDPAITPTNELCELHMTSNTEFSFSGTGSFTKTNIQTGNTLTDTEATPNTFYYTKTSGAYGYIDLGTGNTFQEGDEIWLDMMTTSRAAGDNVRLVYKLNKTNSDEGAVNVNPTCSIAANMATYVRYITQAGDPWVGEQRLYIRRSDSNNRLYQVTIHRTPAAVGDYTVTAVTSTGDNSRGTVSAAASSLDEDGTTSITASPAAGYQVTNWAVADGEHGASISPSGASNATSTTLTMGTANATVTVTFGLIDYTVSKTLTNCAVKDGSTAIPATMNYGDDLSTIIEPTTGNILPSSISVTGVTSYTWNASTGALTLTDVTGNVSISIEAAAPQTGSGTITYALVTSGETAATYSAGAFTGILSSGTPSLNTLGASNTLTGGNGVGVQSDKNTPKSSRTAGITSSTADFNAASSPYAEFTFSVLDGYTFTPTAISVPVLAISYDAYFTAIVTDGSSTWTSTTAECTQGAQAYINAAPSGGSALTGTVNIRVFCHNQATDAKGFRFGTGSVTITGTVIAAGACTPPTIAWDGDQPADAFVSDGSKTFTVTSNHAAGIDLELSPNTCGATVAAKAGSGNLQWIVSFTGAGSVTITPKVVGDGSTVCAETVSATAKTLTVAVGHDVTFNMNGHGTAISKQTVALGGKATEPNEPSAMGYNFGGWFKEAGCENAWDFATDVVNDDTELFAKWTAFVGCTELWPATSGDAPTAADQEIVLQSGSTGGHIYTVSAKSGKFNESFEYTMHGLALKKGGDDVISVVLGNDMAANTKISVTLVAANTGARGLNLLNGTGGSVKGGTTLGWADATVGAVKTFSYTVEAGDGLEGTNIFRLQRSNSVYLKCVKVESCGASVTYHDLTSAVNIAGKGTVTLGASSVREGYTTTAEYSAIDPLYEFVSWSISGEGATLSSTTANPVTVTMGTADAVVTLNLQLIPEKFTVNYYDGATPMGTEDVELNAHPTAAGITTKKLGYTFDGWSETDGGSVVDLNTITRTSVTTMNLYAKYTAIPCPTSGTVYKFQFKTDLTSGNLPVSADADMSEYVNAVGEGELLFTSTSAGQGKIVGDTAIQFTNTAAYLKVNLACALAVGDQIRVRAYGNPVNIQVGTSYDSSKDLQIVKQDFGFKDITSSMVGLNTLYITRASNGNATLTYFEVYRRGKYTVSFDMKDHGSAIADIENVLEGSKITAPTAPTDADYSFAGWYKETTLENAWDFANDVVNANTTLYAKWLNKSDATLKSLKYGDTDIELENDVYVYEIALPSATASVPALTAVTNNPAANAVVTDAAAFDGEGKATSTVVVTPQKEGAATQTYTVKFTKLAELPQVNVTEATEWDFSVAGSTTLQNQTDIVLANVPGINNNATFNSQALKGTFNKMPGGYFQGSKLSFTTEVAGKLTITFRGTNNNERHLKVYVGDSETEVADWTYQGSASEAEQVKTIFVPVGKVTLKAFEGAAAQNARIYHMELSTTPDYPRNVTQGRFGTICLPKAGVMVGADLYEVAYYGATSKKIFFDEILGGVMEAGVPYIFLPKEGVSTLGVFYTSDDVVPAGTYYTDGTTPASTSKNGLIGFIGANENAETAVPDGEGNYILQNNQYREVLAGADARIKSYRAYINLVAITPTAPALAPGRRRISMGVASENSATGMDELNASETPVKMMIDGQLYILRGEKLYDATGRLVK